MLSYYFDLYEPSIVSGRMQIYFRILLVLGFDCFILAAFLLVDPDVQIAPYVYVLGFAFLAPAMIFMRRAYEWVAGQKVFRERMLRQFSRVWRLGPEPHGKCLLCRPMTH